MTPKEVREGIESVVKPFIKDKDGPLKSLVLVFNWKEEEANKEETPLGSIVLPEERPLHVFDVFVAVDLLLAMAKVLNSKSAGNTSQLVSQLAPEPDAKQENVDVTDQTAQTEAKEANLNDNSERQPEETT